MGRFSLSSGHSAGAAEKSEAGEQERFPVLGLTGGYCAGKNLAAQAFEWHDWEVIDVDRLGHRVVAEESEAIIAEFGGAVSDGAGGVDRRALGELVFADRRRLRRLEELVHPEMRRRVARRIEESVAPGLCINAALLFTMGLHRHCTAVLMVRASLLQRIRRGRRRDGLPVTQILLRILRQRKLFPKHLLRDVDIYSVKNSGKPQRLVERVAELIELFER